MNKPILTICIQTFNRATYLECLLSCLPDYSNVSILVGDYSNDEYQAKLNRELCQKRSHTVYFRGRDKGLDHGFNELMKRAVTDYCWLMPDDDIIVEDTLTDVLNVLKNNQPSLLLVNSSIYTENLNKVVKQESFSQIHFLEELSIQNISGVEHILSYIGSCIFNRKLWLKHMKQEHIGTYFNHVYVAAELLNNGYIAFALNLKCIRVRANNALWTENSFQIWTQNWPSALRSLKSNTARLNRGIPVSTLLYYYAYGAISKKRNPLVFRSSKVLMAMDIFGQNFTSIIVYILISIKNWTLVSEPGYYLLKANENKLSNFLLKMYYND